MAIHNKEPRILNVAKRTPTEHKLLYIIITIQIITLIINILHK